MHILRLSEWWRWRRWARSRFKLLIPILTMIKRKMANRRRERKKNAQSQSIHDNNSEYIVFNMSLNANVNTIELSNGYNHTEFTYCRASDIYLFGCCCWFFFHSFSLFGGDMTNMTTKYMHIEIMFDSMPLDDHIFFF